jgi:uncharacterized protein
VTDLSAEVIRSQLGLVLHPTCGYVAETYRSTERIAPGGLPKPFAEGRPLGSALTFLVAPDAPVRLHRIRNDQLYHFQLGDPLEVLLLHQDGSHGEEVVGPNLAAGQVLHLTIHGGTFHTARLAVGGAWFLGCRRAPNGLGSSRPTWSWARSTCWLPASRRRPTGCGASSLSLRVRRIDLTASAANVSAPT